MRYTGPKNKLARRIGEDLGLKSNPQKVAKRIGLRPGMHGKKMRRKVSEFGKQLQEKQKIRFIYGVTEKQLRGLYEVAAKNPSATGTGLLRLLERRLDNVIYRMKFAPTRASARQLVNHGHVLVNGKKMSIASYSVKIDDVVTLKTSGSKIPVIAETIKNATGISVWLSIKGGAGKITRFPEREDIDGSIDEQSVVEFYSR